MRILNIPSVEKCKLLFEYGTDKSKAETLGKECVLRVFSFSFDGLQYCLNAIEDDCQKKGQRLRAPVGS